jgi:glucan endo-1,3-alpha-glucosidase
MLSSHLLLVWLCTPLLSFAAVIHQRSVAQGWSLQSSTCPSGTNSCGAGSCCPSGLYCFAAQADEVASCCTSSRTPFRTYIDYFEKSI